VVLVALTFRCNCMIVLAFGVILSRPGICVEVGGRWSMRCFVGMVHLHGSHVEHGAWLLEHFNI
jgi:hypothetical protein